MKNARGGSFVVTRLVTYVIRTPPYGHLSKEGIVTLSEWGLRYLALLRFSNLRNLRTSVEISGPTTQALDPPFRFQVVCVAPVKPARSPFSSPWIRPMPLLLWPASPVGRRLE